MRTSRLLAPAAIALGLVLGSTRAEDKKPAAEDKKAPTAESYDPGIQIEDPAFDRYVDLSLAAKALADLDAGAAADVALQLMEGERVLLRSHKAATSDQAISLAIKLAIESRDTATIDRLTKAAERAGKKELAEKLALAKTLSAAPRAAEPTIDMGKMSTEGREIANITFDVVRTAKVTADRGALGRLADALKSTQFVTDAERKILLKHVDDAVAALPNKVDPAMAPFLQQLSGASRGDIAVAGTLAIEIDGGSPSNSGSVVNVNIATGGSKYNVVTSGTDSVIGNLANLSPGQLAISVTATTATVRSKSLISPAVYIKDPFGRKILTKPALWLKLYSATIARPKQGLSLVPPTASFKAK